MKQKLLICGGTGFIGRNLLEKLPTKKYKIYATYNKKKPFKSSKITWIKCDLRKKRDVDQITRKKDIIIQAAATTSGSKDIINQPYIHVTDNVVMNAYLFRACFKNKVKHVIFLSCTNMYKSSQKPLSENDFDPRKDIDPRYFGAANTKLYNEKMCEFYANLGTTKFTAIRHSNIYGPYDKFDLKKSHVFGATITKVMKAKNSVTIWGKGNEKRDLLFIDDLVNFIHLVIKKQKNNFEIFNCGYGSSISINSLVKKIIKLSGKKLKIINDLSKPSIPTFLSLNCNKAKKILKWKKKVSLDKGIINTLKWRKKIINSKYVQ